jgi:addiction module HigA family antidote
MANKLAGTGTTGSSTKQPRANLLMRGDDWKLPSEKLAGLDRIPPSPPGETIREDYLEPLGMTPYRLAKELGITPIAMKEILDGHRAITANTALRLARYWGTTAEFWMNLQARYDLEIEEEKRRGEIAKIRPFAEAV